MAKPACTFCGEFEGVLMDTNLMTGETQVPCGGCLPGYALTMAAELSGDLSPEAAEQYGLLFDQIAANDTRTTKSSSASTTKTPRKRKSATPADSVNDAAPDGDAPSPSSATGTHATPAQDGTETVQVPEDQRCECGALTATGDAVKLVCDGCGAVLATADESDAG